MTAESAQSDDIREATAADADEIAKVHVASWRVAYAELLPPELLGSLDIGKRAEAWRSILAEGSGTAYVARCASGILGFVHLCASRDDDEPAGQVGEITSIYLAPEAFDRGWGAKLLDRALRKLSVSGMRQVTLWVLERNQRACRFYEHKGFALDGKAKVHHTGLKEVRYRRALDVISNS